jgi:hypothetical protein
VQIVYDSPINNQTRIDMTSLSKTQLGDKKDRTYRIAIVNQPKFFTVKGVGKSFMLFDGEQLVQSFKTLTKCCDYIKESATA